MLQMALLVCVGVLLQRFAGISVDARRGLQKVIICVGIPALKTPDGKIYALSSVVDGAAYADPYGFLINQKWLDKLGLDEPQTLDDWYEVLKAFKEDDPNGNGEQDEIPLSPAYGNWGLGLFGSALDFHLYEFVIWRNSICPTNLKLI